MYFIELAKENNYLSTALQFDFDKDLVKRLRENYHYFEKDTGGLAAEGDEDDREDFSIRRVDMYSFDFNSEKFDGVFEGSEKQQELQELIGEVHAELEAIIEAANKYFEFDLYGIEETINLLHYHNADNTVPGHYVGHNDIGEGSISRRKLTVIVQLSDESEYDGCTLNISAYGDADKNVGNVIVFPSYLEHSVSPIERGERFCLNLWVHGPTFR